MKNTQQRFGLLLLPFCLLGCSKSFDKLEPQEATHALGVCLAYHSAVRKDLEKLSDKVRTLTSYPNVRANLTDQGQDWIARYYMGDKEVLLKEAEDSCRISGLPF